MYVRSLNSSLARCTMYVHSKVLFCTWIVIVSTDTMKQVWYVVIFLRGLLEDLQLRDDFHSIKIAPSL